MPVLYRDYRPKIFSEVINQEHIKTTLQNSAASGSFAHAYLFTGPRGTGKTTLARIFARAINCENQKNGEPCNKCAVCKQFLDGNALDLSEIDAASNTGIENIREIIEHLKFSPTQAKYKVFIVDEVHMLSKGAFNALLKTLEEPPKHAVFILATTEIHKVPATVISRTQRFDFKRINNKELLPHLKSIAQKEKIDIDDESLQLIVNSSEGSVRDALSVLDKLGSFGKIGIEQAEILLGITNVFACQSLLDLIIQKDAKGALQYIEELFSKGLDPIQFNKDFLEYLRKLLMYSIGGNENFPLDQTQMETLRRQAGEIKTAQLLLVIRLFLRANKDFETSPSAELPLEIAIAESVLGASGANSIMTQAVKQNTTETVKKKFEKIVETQSSSEVETVEEQAEELKIAPEKMIAQQELLKEWSKVLAKVREVHSPLLAVMQSVKIKSVENNNITLSFGYKFHKDSLDNKKNKDLLLKILDEHFQTQFRLTIIFEKDNGAQNKTDVSSIAMDVFGGEII